MNLKCARALNELNARFYSEVHDSFSGTRSGAWPGWERALHETGLACGSCAPLRVLDAACGNLRFERWLQGELGEGACEFHALDNCDALLAQGVRVRYVHADLVERLLSGGPLHALLVEGVDLAAGASIGPDADAVVSAEADLAVEPVFDLAVSFGFLHHVPGREMRERLLRELVACVRPGGFVAVSLWRFMSDERLARKAAGAQEAALAELAERGVAQEELEPGDFFLGWRDVKGVYRYCHHFDEEEVSALADAVSGEAMLVARYKADGKAGDLNHYLVLQRRG